MIDDKNFAIKIEFFNYFYILLTDLNVHKYSLIIPLQKYPFLTCKTKTYNKQRKSITKKTEFVLFF